MESPETYYWYTLGLIRLSETHCIFDVISDFWLMLLPVLNIPKKADFGE